MLYPVNRASAEVLDKIAAAPRLGDIGFEWTSGWNETTDRRLSYFQSQSAVPDDWANVILQGPHLTVAIPLFTNPRYPGWPRVSLRGDRPRSNRRGLHPAHRLPGRQTGRRIPCHLSQVVRRA